MGEVEKSKIPVMKVGRFSSRRMGLLINKLEVEGIQERIEFCSIDLDGSYEVVVGGCRNGRYRLSGG